MNIGIAGAGLSGRLLAWRLLRAGHAVTIYDRDHNGEQSAGYIAAAMLAPFSEAVTVGPDVLQPGLEALQRWPAWLAELESETGIAVPFQRAGSVVVAHGSDRADLHWFYRRLQDLPGACVDGSRWLDGAQLRALEPDLAGFAEGVHLPREGWLDNRILFRALQAACDALGATWHDVTEVASVSAAGIETGDGVTRFDLLLDCRGIGARAQLDDFRGVRGELLRVQATEVRLSRPVRLMHPRYQLYVAPRPDNIYVIGATEIESESMAPVTVRSSLELLSALYSVHSGFAEAEVLEARAHCRPAFADNLPRIIRRDRLLQVNGLYRHGYLLAPALVDSVMSLLAGGAVSAPVQLDDHNDANYQLLREAGA